MRAIAEATQLFVEYTRLATGLVDAHQGRLVAARKAAVDGVDFAVRVGEPVLAHQNRALLGFVELSDGNVTEAADELERWEAVARGLGYRDPFHLLRGALNEAEALVAADRLDRAAAVLDWFEAAGAATGRAWPAVLARRVRGLLFAARGELDDALDCVASLGDNPSLASLPFERGRALLAAGTIRRRLKHRREAREDLQQAHATFEALGAGPWARRAEIELRRIGGRTATVRELTATEQRIANLVATGRTNREVAAEAFVSVKTVEGTLTRIYAKLGVRSRTELARALSRRTGSG